MLTDIIHFTLLQSSNEEHMKLVNDMGITVATLADGRVQLLHTFSNVSTYTIFVLCCLIFL